MGSGRFISSIGSWAFRLREYRILAFTMMLSLSAWAQTVDLHKVDSLFMNGKQAESEVLYEKYLATFTNKTLVPLPIYYKLALINEKENDYARALYYLSMIYNRQPRQNILNKITEIAANHNLTGYEVDDFSFVFLFFRKYSLYFTLFLLVVGIYTFGVLVQKKRHNESIRSRHKWVVIVYLIALILLLNLPDSYQIAIINKSPTHLREVPSSAAPVKWSIAKGNKVTVIGEQDEWLRIWWEQQPLYVRKLDVWAVR
ncbi:MAG: hypothetical protein WCJ44_21010 [Runella sp.]